MADRPLLAPNLNNPLINAQSMGTSITGPVTFLKGLTGIAYDISWTGTPTGTFTVEVSNSYSQAPNGDVLTVGNWTQLPSTAFVGSMPTPSGSSGNGMIDIVGTEANCIRLVYTRSSGTGALTVYPCAKVL